MTESGLSQEKFNEVINLKVQEIRDLRKRVKEQDEQIVGLRTLRDKALKDKFAEEATSKQLKEHNEGLGGIITGAYQERAKLLAFISSFLPSVFKKDQALLESSYANVLYMVLPTGEQVSFHIHENDMKLFEHVPDDATANAYLRDLIWDGHDNTEKWERFKYARGSVVL